MDASRTQTCRQQASTDPSGESDMFSGTSPYGAWTLEVVPCQAIRLHEDHDPSRAEPLVQAMARDGVQRHPIILARAPDHMLLHIDGANRLTALERLGCPHVVAQVVDYADPQIALTTWVHLTRLTLTTLQQAIASWPAQQIESITPAEAPTVLARERCVAVIVPTDGTVLALYSGMGLLDRVTAMRQLVATYGMPPVREALPEGAPVPGVQTLLARTPQATAAVMFGPLRKADVITLALDLGMPMPAGVTRHLLHGGRLLHVNAPLALLRAEMPVAEKAARLRATLARQQCRVYAEKTIVYEPL